MKRKNKFISFAMCFALILTSLGWTGNDKAHAAVDESDFDVNTAWTLSNDITTIYSVNNADGERAYSLGTSKIGDYVVNVNLVKQKDRNDGATSLTKNGQNQAAYKATREMFYGNPDPSKIPALGIWTQASDGVGGPLGSWDKINFNGAEEVATLTFTFDKAVTDPILDLSGLGGYAYAAGTFDDINGHKSLVARGSFNGTDIELLTDGITLESLTGSNIVVDSKSINIKDRNTHSYSAEYPEKIVTHTDDDFGTQYSPKLTGSGAGSVKLKGTFNEVSFKLSHHAVPFSSFPKETYGTSDPYFANYGGKDNPRYGDGINGWNLMTSEKFYVGDFEMAQSNSDLFRVSLRLEKPSSIGDTVWFDKDADGIQGLGEQGLDGITVKLLDKDGNPAKDYNGKLVSDQVTSNGGKYKFENLAAGEYIVQVVPGESQKLTKESQGTDTEKDSNVNPETGKTAIISLEANTNLTDIDAGIVKEYKVDYEFQPSTVEGTPKELPQGVKDQLPAEKAGLADGTSVESPKGFTSVRDEVNKGTWSFEAWDQETATIQGADEHVVGTWVFTPDTYKVDYEFQPSTVEGTPKELPQGVKDQLPAEKAELADGTSVESPKGFTSVRDEVNKGTWSFEAWDQETATIQGADEHVVGTWVFTPDTYKVDYEFQPSTAEGTPKELPQGVKDQLPAEKAGLADGTSVESPKGFTSVRDEANKGTWSFEAWDQETATIQGADEHVVGTWVFTPDTIEPPIEEKGTVYVKYITEDGTILEDITVVKQDAPVGEAYTTE
ncbi:SHIRT domain-containing protein, partial [Peptoniphilaceae bacterium SGI.137]